MCKVIYILICLLIYTPIRAQVNLIIDPSFEAFDSCSILLGLTGSKHWHSLDSSNNIQPHPTQIYSPVYINTCDNIPFSLSACPNSYGQGFSYMYPRTGNGMYENVFHLDFNASPWYNRDYLRGRIRNQLINGKQYCGKYYVNLYHTMKYGIDRLGAYLDNGALDVNPCMLPIVVTPTWENSTFTYITDTVNWTRIQGLFTANGTENFITIGNFYSDANTHKIVFNASANYAEAYYYVDDVSIIAMDITAYAGEDATICVSDSIHLGRPQEVGLECLWYKPTVALPFASTSDIWFKPTQAGNYTFIQRMDNCQITFDTVNITVLNDCSSLLPIKTIPNVFTPNGDGINDVWEFSLGLGNTLKSLSVYNRWGNSLTPALSEGEGVVPSQRVVRWDGRTTSGMECSEGVYFYTLEYKDAKGDVIKKNGYVSLIK